jgi:choline kinase
MRPILIGAGRGSRLQHLTKETPKSLVPVMGRPILAFILDALKEAGFAPRDVVFICGYGADVLRKEHPEFTFVYNDQFEHNNILLSLLYAREFMSDGFVSSYTDILYKGSVVSALLEAPHDKALACDTDWRRRYKDRSQHPESDGEKMRAEGDRILELSRRIPPSEAQGEFIGVAKFTRGGARELLSAFDAARRKYAGATFRDGRSFEKAYLIDLFQDMIEKGADFRRVDTHGGYIEVDTLEDVAMAEKWWSR